MAEFSADADKAGLEKKGTRAIPHVMGGAINPFRRAAKMALFKVKTGCREQEVCKLKWDWEIYVPELEVSVFLIPSDFGGRNERSGVKNGDERLVVLNSVAKSIIDKQRGLSDEWVFPYKGNPIQRMNDSAWRKARKRAGNSDRRKIFAQSTLDIFRSESMT